MDCRIIRIVPADCFHSNVGGYNSGGPGLFGHDYDACNSWIQTVERQLVFQFGQAHYRPTSAHLYVLKGKQLDPDNLQGKTIAFLIGWYQNEQCLARKSQDFTVNKDNVKHFVLADQALEAMQNGEVDAVFGISIMWSHAQRPLVEKVEKPFICYIGGNAMMARKDSHFIANWNVAFNKFKSTNNFLEFCDEANERHKAAGIQMNCIA